MDSYVLSLATDLFSAFGVDEERISLRIEARPVQLNLDTAIPFGLLVSELVTNALKYAFPADREVENGEITISFSEQDDGNYLLTVSDNGIGFPEEFDLAASASLGLKLVHTMVEQLGGEVSLAETPGTTWTITCPPYHGAEGVVDPSFD
jgi:two-component sensor histidine kinase